MALKKGEFVRLHFTGAVTETGDVFDTTREDVAREHQLHRGDMQYEPLTICVGEGFVLPALDEAIIGQSENGSFTVTLQPEQAFGKKRADHLKLMPLAVFKKQKVQPQPGLEVNIDNVRGVIKTVQANRVIVDFNHPLSGKEITYDLETLGKVTELPAQVEAVVGRTLGFAPEITVSGAKATITLPIELPKEVQDQVKERVTSLTSAEDLVFVKHEHKH